MCSSWESPMGTLLPVFMPVFSTYLHASRGEGHPNLFSNTLAPY